ncbi:MAG: ComF family protein [Bacteroidales bacterium]|nr:ComF family protein [Bacteroidales bacterium]
MDPRLNGLTLKTSLSALLDLVLPRVCVVCGRALLPGERHLCLGCLSDLPQTRYESLSHNPMADRFNERIRCDEYEPYAYAAALYHYRADAGYKRISQALKYHRDFGTGRWAARRLGGNLAASPLYADVDLVVPVPLHWTRQWRRGYNQAAVIAREVARSLDAPCRERLLRRVRRTRSQTRLSGKEKMRNVSGAFALRSGRLPAAGHILLIDDVFTTGATLAACHRALRTRYGPQVRISVATLGVVGE